MKFEIVKQINGMATLCGSKLAYGVFQLFSHIVHRANGGAEMPFAS